jgi:rod shape-determining protein MreC
MFSRKAMILVGLIALFAVSVIALTISNRFHPSTSGIGQGGLAVVGPFQEALTLSVRSVRDVWRHYFDLVEVSRENDILRRELERAVEAANRYRELELANERLRKLLQFREHIEGRAFSAEIIGKDPSPWFKTVIIDKGRNDGVDVGYPVVVPEGVVGQVIEASTYYAKVLLVIDTNHAVDGLVQRTRARGIVQGSDDPGKCVLRYALRKDDIHVGDIIVSSGLDGVFPKGMRVGRVSGLMRPPSGIFQEVTVTPFVDFETLEEVLVVATPPARRIRPRP